MSEPEVMPEVPASGTTARVALSPAAADLLVTLSQIHGPLMFHQSGGCCDGSSPMCYPDGDFKIGGSDVHLGDLGGLITVLAIVLALCGAPARSRSRSRLGRELAATPADGSG